MLKRPFLFAAPLLALAAAGPIAFYSAPGLWANITGSASPPTSSQTEDGLAGLISGSPFGATAASPAEGPPASAGETQGSPQDVPVHDLADVLRFDLSPDWVVRHWPRVSAALAYLELQGYRVPLVTGTAEDDLAGALTYYFNPQQQLQRITFQGTTGNARKVVELVTTRFGFARRLTNDASVFLYEIPGSNGRATSFLWIRPAPVVKASDPHHRFEVALVIERPEKR
jgi:hypothetical protein